MKKSIRLFLAVVLAGLVGLAGTRVSAVEPKAKAPDIPGSGVEPPKAIEAPLPPALNKKSAGVVLGVWIKEDGAVDAADFINGSEDWRETTIATVKRWRFEPVLWQGKAIPARTEVQFVQEDPKHIRSAVSPLPNLPGEIHTEDEFGVTKPVLEVDPDLILPLMVRSRRLLSIDAGLNYIILEDGSTDKIELFGASSEGAVRSALDLIAERKYKPAKVRETPIVMQYKQVLSFQSMEKPIESLSGALDIVDPAYPYERMLAGEEGYAVVRFTLTGKGTVEKAEVVEASHPDFGGALVAAVESWFFTPEAASEQITREYRHDFVLSNTPYATRRLIKGVREGKVTSNAAGGLDARPKLLAQPALAYPTSLYSQQVSGLAEIEFVVDRVGLAQLPRVIKATQPEFGWAAVTLVNGMRFMPLTKGGKPTELRVRIPVNFVPSKSAEPAAAAKS